MFHHHHHPYHSWGPTVKVVCVCGCAQCIGCIPGAEVALTGAAIASSDRTARDGAEGRPHRQEPNPGQDQGRER